MDGVSQCGTTGIALVTEHSGGDHIKENEMGRACGTERRKVMQTGLWGE